MLHRINKALPLTWLDPKTLQIGLGEKQKRLAEVTITEEKIIEALVSGIVAGQESVLEETIQAEAGTTAKLIQLLGSSTQSIDQQSYGPWQELAFAELARASLDYEVNGEMVIAERWQKIVHVDQLDKAGLLLTKGLMASGIGLVVSHDEGVVLRTDLGELGYPSEELGKQRAEAANRICNSLSSTTNYLNRVKLLAGKPIDQKISFGVTVGHLAIAPRTYSRWLSRDVNHLAINFELDGAMVSPIVKPGSTPCLNCFQEHLVDVDQSWPIVGSQLLNLPRVRDDSAALLSTVGLALRSILRNLDEQSGFQFRDNQNEYELGYKIEYSSGNVSRMKFMKHELCSCGNFTETGSNTY